MEVKHTHMEEDATVVGVTCDETTHLYIHPRAGHGAKLCCETRSGEGTERTNKRNCFNGLYFTQSIIDSTI